MGKHTDKRKQERYRMETRYEEEGLKERTREIEKSIIKRFRKEIWRRSVSILR